MWAALLPDGELSLFEQRLLEAHCARCAECREVRVNVSAFTELIRETRPETMGRRVRVLRMRPRYWRTGAGACASGGAAVLALVVAVWVGPQAHSDQNLPTVTNAPVIVLTPEAGTADSEAIWRLKRMRSGLPVSASETRHTGPVL